MMSMDMDDSAMEGTPWLDEPVMLHSDRSSTCSLTPEQCVYRNYYWRYWYEADHVYALPTVYLFVAAIALSTIGFWALRLAPASLRRKTWWQKGVATARLVAYSRFRSKYWNSPSLGIVLLLTIGTIFFILMTLAPQPYYWPTLEKGSFGGSPPIATRAGWMSLACLPFMIILPSKANMIASLTGASHERLIVLHNWIGWVMFALALVHTFPFIVYNMNKGTMMEEWNSSLVYWTGVVALLAQFYLQVFSLRFIRDRFYEFFKATHFLAALIFVLFFFFHCDFRLSSWDYFIATGVLYVVSLLYSQVRTYFEHGISHRANFQMVSEHALKVEIPIDNTWKPGQHIFLRFIHLGMHAFTAHPFTPRGGLTGRLAKAAMKQPGFSVPVLLNGPYGGVKGRPLHMYDSSLVVACGAGAGLSLPFVMEALSHTARQVSSGSGKAAHKMHVIVATRDRQLATWYNDALCAYMQENDIESMPENIRVSIFQTGTGESKSDIELADPERQEKDELARSTSRESLPLKLSLGRPDIAACVRSATAEQGATVAITACGPADVLRQVQQEAAAAQKRVLSSQAGASEVYLHSEVFSW